MVVAAAFAAPKARAPSLPSLPEKLPEPPERPLTSSESPGSPAGSEWPGAVGKEAPGGFVSSAKGSRAGGWGLRAASMAGLKARAPSLPSLPAALPEPALPLLPSQLPDSPSASEVASQFGSTKGQVAGTVVGLAKKAERQVVPADLDNGAKGPCTAAGTSATVGSAGMKAHVTAAQVVPSMPAYLVKGASVASAAPVAAGITGMKDLLAQWDHVISAIDSLSVSTCKQVGEAPGKPLGQVLRESRRAGGYDWAAPAPEAPASEAPVLNQGDGKLAADTEALQRYLQGCRIHADGEVVDKDGVTVGRLGTDQAAAAGSRAGDPYAAKAAAAEARAQRLAVRVAEEVESGTLRHALAAWRKVHEASRLAAERDRLSAELSAERTRTGKLLAERHVQVVGRLALRQRDAAALALEACFATWREHAVVTQRGKLAQELQRLKADCAASQMGADARLHEAAARDEKLRGARARADAEATAAAAAQAAAQAAEAARAEAEAAAAAAARERDAARCEAAAALGELAQARSDVEGAKAEVAALRKELLDMHAFLINAREELRRAHAETKVAQCELLEARASGAGKHVADVEEVQRLRGSLAQVRAEVTAACAALCRPECGLRDRELAVAHLRHVLELFRDSYAPLMPELLAPQGLGSSSSAPLLPPRSPLLPPHSPEASPTAERRRSSQDLGSTRTKRRERWAPQRA